MKIAYVFSSDMMGGAECLAESLISSLDDSVEFFVINCQGEFSNRLLEKGLRVYQIPGLNRLGRPKRKTNAFISGALFILCLARTVVPITRILLKERPTLVHINNINAFSKILPSFFLLRAIRKLSNFNPAWILSRHDYSYYGLPDKFFNYVCCMAIDYLIAVSFYVKEELKSQLPVKKIADKIFVIHNSIDITKYKYLETKRVAFRKEQGFSQNDIVIAMVGRIAPSKGSFNLLKAFALLIRKNKSIGLQLVFAGEILQEDQQYAVDIKNYALEHCCLNRVVFLGKVKEMHTIYSGFDIVVNYSSSVVGESFGLTLIEAMACNCIAVGSDLGGIKEVIEHNKSGFLVYPDNPHLLFECLDEIITKWNHYKTSVSRYALENVKARFTLERMTNDYQDLYSLAANHSGK